MLAGRKGPWTAAGGKRPWVFSKLWSARPMFFRLLAHATRWAAPRTFWTAATRSPTGTPMMAITTSNWMSVNAGRAGRRSAVLRAHQDRRAIFGSCIWAMTAASTVGVGAVFRASRRRLLGLGFVRVDFDFG